MKMNSSVLFILFSLLCYTETYRILVFYPLYVKSLNNLGEGIVNHLLNDGHEVTYVTTHPLDNPQNKNLRQIDISSNNIFINHTYNVGELLENKIVEADVFECQDFAQENARITFQHKNVITLLENKKENFDVVIADLFESEVYAGLSVLYNCPMIWMYSMGAHWQVLKLIADPGNPAYDTNYFGFHLPPFTFHQRIAELWSRVKWSFYKKFVTAPKERVTFESVFKPLLAKRGRELPDYDDVVYNASMIFANEHNAILARPSTPQNFKSVGGMHIKDPVPPLPKVLQDLMDNAPHGVIYFSMGSFWTTKDIPMKLTRQLLNMFGELKETVIWKYEDVLEDVPKNVHLVRWAPQQSILAHPNCRIFISHGGLLSSIETVHFGIPIIGVPVLFDQHVNVKKAVANGYAIKVDFDYDLPHNLKAAINLLQSDESYRKRAKELSSIYHDIPTKPGAELVHWVRHVIRTRGAAHLRSPALRVPLYQRLFLDLAALIIGIFFTIYVCLCKVLKRRMSVIKEKKN